MRCNTLLNGALLPLLLAQAAQSAVLPPSPDRDPSPNILDYLDTRSSAASSGCAFTVASGSLVFPGARISHSPAGHIDCTTRLAFAGLPTGYAFSIQTATVAGYLSLEKGSFVDKIQVRVAYASNPSSADQAAAKNPYGKYGVGYDGAFSLPLALTPEGARSSLATSGCSARDGTAAVTVALWISLSHEAIEFDDTLPHAGSVGGDGPGQQVRAALDTLWTPFFVMPFIEISSDDSSSLAPSPSPSPAPSRWLSLSREDDPYPRRKGGEGDQVDID
ncbi:hypothetical protein B0T26DRAFT_875247 [Lasiosphaeria miniovina]|uniref:Uncharacterized protein n=1 Tax=Lasiosphaeria miniovina TaxID=1954250 RepID=A0AA40DJJ3_9PEZI|nr:uncharacterized protein B0T26DRAFT_875247 [Lasiosphaeria miniovina]KAK0705949.1 hypothetical protein B0T26DRAFT_875247 [Lasiosphaeria miniovina]